MLELVPAPGCAALWRPRGHCCHSMLETISAEIIHCRERARLAREKADTATTAEAKNDCLAAEARWLALATRGPGGAAYHQFEQCVEAHILFFKLQSNAVPGTLNSVAEPGVTLLLRIVERRRYSQFALLEVNFTKWLQCNTTRLGICAQELCDTILTSLESSRGHIGTSRHDDSQHLAQICSRELLVWYPDGQKLIESRATSPAAW
jgi:hypothetical protein